MNYTVDELINAAGKLPPLPQAAQKALTLIRNPESGAAEVAIAIAVDQVLASIVLRWANSAYYSVTNRVATVQQAVMVLGLDVVHELILALSVAQFLNKPLPGYDLKQGELWRHSLGVAFGARALAQQRGWKDPEEAYYAGLLCDIGKLALEKLLRELNGGLADWDNHTFLELEQARFGVDHALLGAEMARRWRLPENLAAAIQYHHQPAQAGDYVKLASLVHVADAAMMMLGVGVGKDGLRYALDPQAMQILNLSEQDLYQLMERMMGQIRLAEAFVGLTANDNNPARQ